MQRLAPWLRRRPRVEPRLGLRPSSAAVDAELFPSTAHVLCADRDKLWHPYTSVAQPGPVWAVDAACGAEMKLEDGRILLDGMASWWCAVHGYNVPELNAAVEAQLKSTAHIMFGGLTHRPAVGVAHRLVHDFFGSRDRDRALEKVFLCDSGSVAVEVALKMALQYWFVKGRPEKKRMLTVRGGYHGDTLGCMAVCDPVKGMHKMFAGVLPEHLFAERPYGAHPNADPNADHGDDGFGSMEAMLRAHHGEVAAVILEPVVQGAGGMHMYSAAYLDKLRRLCDELDVLLIYDEIATGFGRTGELFAMDHADAATPDIVCIGKALTGGYMTMGAVVATTRVGAGVSGNEGTTPLMHGPTFMANPLSASVAAASLDLLLERRWNDDVTRIQAALGKGLAPARKLPGVKDVRVLGAIGVIELDEAPAPRQADALQAALVAEGVWIRPFGELLYTMPPYVMTDAQIERLCAALVGVTGRYTAGEEVGFSAEEMRDIFGAETASGSAGRLRWATP